MARASFAVFLWAAAAASPALAQSAPSNVPDVIARKSGLHLEPMARAAVTYAANCQGCHGEKGVSVTEIPSLAGRIGYFTRTPAGRRYLVQVPNVALNPSSDEDIARMMNWLLDTYSRAQLASDFEPYSTEEVAHLRKARIDAPAERRRVVDELVRLKQVPSPDVLAIPHSALY